MKKHAFTRVWLGLAVVWGLASATVAVARPTSGGDDNRTPAAPEPEIIVMAVSGLVLGGGYVLWRRRSRKSPNT